MVPPFLYSFELTLYKTHTLTKWTHSAFANGVLESLLYYNTSKVQCLQWNPVNTVTNSSKKFGGINVVFSIINNWNVDIVYSNYKKKKLLKISLQFIKYFYHALQFKNSTRTGSVY